MSRLLLQLPSESEGLWWLAGLGRKNAISSRRLLCPSTLKYFSHLSCVLFCLVLFLSQGLPVTQAGLRLSILLSPTHCWDYMYVLPCLGTRKSYPCFKPCLSVYFPTMPPTVVLDKSNCPSREPLNYLIPSIATAIFRYISMSKYPSCLPHWPTCF